MADEDFTRRVPFMFLDNVQQLFTERYGDRARTAIAFAMNEEFSRVLQTQLEYYNSDPAADNIGRVRSQINDVKDVMVQNIEKVLERGEKIELLVDKTDKLNQQAFKFEKQSKRLKSAMWWKNVKMTIFLVAAALVSFLRASLALRRTVAHARPCPSFALLRASCDRCAPPPASLTRRPLNAADHLSRARDAVRHQARQMFAFEVRA